MQRPFAAGGDFPSAPELDYEGWRNAIRPQWGWYNPEAIEHKAFTGRARPRCVCGFVGMDITCNAPRVERTQRDVRLDDMEHFYAVFKVTGRSTIIQNDQAVNLGVGDATLIDSARPVTYVNDDGYGQFFSLQLPRRSLVSHLGFEPHYASSGRGKTRAGRLLFSLFWMPSKMKTHGSRRVAPTCRWRSMISSVHSLHPRIRCPSIRKNCSVVFAASSKIVSLILS
jgi:hypothetical protein